VDACSIQMARDTAKEWTGKLSEWKRHGYKEDENPFETSRGELKFDQLIDRYIKGRVHKKATQPEKAEKAVTWMVKKYLSEWKGRKLDQISRREVRVLHDRLGREHGRVTADRCVQLIRRMYYWAASEKVELWSGENPATKIEFNGYTKRDRFLQPDELVRLDRALQSETNQDFKDFVELALATGARRSNVLAMKWAEINDEHRVWIIPKMKTKTGDTYVLPLHPRAVTVLKRRARSGPWVFPSPLSKTGHLVEPKKPWKRLLLRANITGFTIHDLRRTNASYQSIAGQSLQAIAKTLGHASTASTEVYAKLNTDAARAALVAGGRMMERTMIAARKRQKKQSGRVP
jgi:integrase